LKAIPAMTANPPFSSINDLNKSPLTEKQTTAIDPITSAKNRQNPSCLPISTQHHRTPSGIATTSTSPISLLTETVGVEQSWRLFYETAALLRAMVPNHPFPAPSP